MMSVAPVASAGEAAGYYSNSDNYYFLGSLQSLWMGKVQKRWALRAMSVAMISRPSSRAACRTAHGLARRLTDSTSTVPAMT